MGCPIMIHSVGFIDILAASILLDESDDSLRHEVAEVYSSLDCLISVFSMQQLSCVAKLALRWGALGNSGLVWTLVATIFARGRRMGLSELDEFCELTAQGIVNLQFANVSRA